MTKTYYGTKRILAWSQQNTDGEDGYAVKYSDGYTSWSPKKVFEDAYQPVDAMNFGHALQALREGHKVARAGWNGKKMFIFLTQGRTVPNTKDRSFAHFDGDEVVLASHIDMKAADGSFVTGWLASQTDMLAEDWCIVETKENDNG